MDVASTLLKIVGLIRLVSCSASGFIDIFNGKAGFGIIGEAMGPPTFEIECANRLQH